MAGRLRGFPAQAGQVHDIFVVDRARPKHGVDAAQAAQPTSGRADMGQGRDGDAVIIADQHCFDLAGTVDQQPDLAV